ncbi:hypothetical protein CLV63_10155 [Murinocardiopsis flavida]|uniref:Bleomycin resistance protein n=1 Tax=Murinocardiopsis flavida TaxID=645275 RepID=A0A2P8DTP0_9ACTN|nr:glyoxalase superfamily protein [Murinocardiopsis flavida]PSL00581.1 hypothetical protein CLV63_10155 [Murinocardiopsis flavida]
MEMTTADAKRAAAALRADLAQAGARPLSHGRSLEIVAHQLGYRDWNTAAAALGDPADSGAGHPVPVLRIQDDRLAREFYLDYLGCTVEWEHRFEPGMPLYLRLRRDRMVIDLSGHHGDGVPGSVVWVPVADIGALHRELSANPYPRIRPGVDKEAPGGPTLAVTDPFANTIRFCEPTG